MKKVSMALKTGENVRAYGNHELLTEKYAKLRYGFAGARREVTETSRDWIKAQVDKMNPDEHILVSGLAIGSDTYAHVRALKNGVKQVAVLPSGINNVYPHQNRALARRIVKNGGVLVSMLEDKASPSPNTFIERNKLIINLSRLLVVNQFNVKSGTRHTVDYAKNAGKLIIVQNGDYTGNKYIIRHREYVTVVK